MKINFKKIFLFIFISFLIYFFFFQDVLAQGVNSSLLSCEPRIFSVDSLYKLPYKYDGVEIKSGNSTVKSNDYLIYSVKVKNNLVPERQIIQKIYIKQLLGNSEPITILDAKAVGGDCVINNYDKSIFCNLNYSFVEEATDPIYVLLKINNFFGEIPKTSSLFTIQTNKGSTECANFLWLKEETKPNKINWQTPYVSFNASDFYIKIKDKKFYGKEPIKIISDPGIEKTTLEATWQENGVEMRLFMYFQKKLSNMWEMYELRTYNGQNPGDWIYYKDSLGETVEGLIGYQNYKNQRDFIPLNNQDAQVHCLNCSINAFLNQTQITSDKEYILEPLIGLPQGEIIKITNDPMTGYGVNVLLKNKNGEVVKDQSDIIYDWKVDNSNIIQIKTSRLEDDNGCLYGILPPCPLNHVDISGVNPGRAQISVSSIRKLDNQVLASTSFLVDVILKEKLPVPDLCAQEGEVIKKGETLKCCDRLLLVPPIDDRIDIFGTCLKPCYKDLDCQSNQICSLNSNNQLVCVPGERVNKQIQEIKKNVDQINQNQTQIQIILNKIILFLKKLFKFKI